MRQFLREAWGTDQEVTLEESGQRIRFFDVVESVCGTTFRLEPPPSAMTNAPERSPDPMIGVIGVIG